MCTPSAIKSGPTTSPAKAKTPVDPEGSSSSLNPLFPSTSPAKAKTPVSSLDPANINNDLKISTPRDIPMDNSVAVKTSAAGSTFRAEADKSSSSSSKTTALNLIRNLGAANKGKPRRTQRPGVLPPSNSPTTGGTNV